MTTTTEAPAVSPVVYNRAAKAYAIATDTATTYPTRDAAELAYIAAIAPHLAQRVTDVAEKMPHLAKRAREAALLVIAQAVTVLDAPRQHAPNVQIVATVTSRTRADVAHTISTNDHGGPRGPEILCTCEDAREGKNTYYPTRGHACAHALAYRWHTATTDAQPDTTPTAQPAPAPKTYTHHCPRCGHIHELTIK